MCEFDFSDASFGGMTARKRNAERKKMMGEIWIEDNIVAWVAVDICEWNSIGWEYE